MEKFKTFLENFMKWNGKIYSWLFPAMAFLMAIGLSWRIFYVPWKAGVVLFFLALICFYAGIYLLIKRKSLGKEQPSTPFCPEEQ